jgi:hypothetical protein
MEEITYGNNKEIKKESCGESERNDAAAQPRIKFRTTKPYGIFDHHMNKVLES